jgi:hypothetical protein
MNCLAFGGASLTRPNRLWRALYSWGLLLFLVAIVPAISHAQTRPARPAGAEPKPEPAISAILAAFDKYEVVGMPEAHGMKDLDDFILLLIRNPSFPAKVNDIAVECGNSMYQSTLDRYIAGEDVPFVEVQKVWRNTTQSMCGNSGFFEQFFPLVRAINQKLPSEKRLRVLAGDSPIDWDHVKTAEDYLKFLSQRDPTTASVMEKEVLSKHRKALMLFGTFHLFHGVRNAVSSYEKDYPNVTFIIEEVWYFSANSATSPQNPFTKWQPQSLAKIKNTWIANVGLDSFAPPPVMIDKNCKATSGFPESLQKPMGELVDAILYLGPGDLRLKEQLPANIALDIDYMTELERRDSLSNPFGGKTSREESNRRIVKSASNPLVAVPPPPDLKRDTQNCLDRKNSNTAH